MQYLSVCSHLFFSGTQDLWHSLIPVQVTGLQFCLDRSIFGHETGLTSCSQLHLCETKVLDLFQQRDQITTKPFFKIQLIWKKPRSHPRNQNNIHCMIHGYVLYLLIRSKRHASLCCKMYLCIKKSQRNLNNVAALRLIHMIDQQLINFMTIYQSAKFNTKSCIFRDLWVLIYR